MVTRVGSTSGQISLPADINPKIRKIGSPDRPITLIQDLGGELFVTATKRITGPYPIDVIVIHGDGNLEIDKDPGILQLDPKRLVLIGTRIVRRSGTDCLDAKMLEAGWYCHSDDVRKTNPAALGVIVMRVNSVQEALDAPAVVNPQTNEPYRMIYEVIA